MNAQHPAGPSNVCKPFLCRSPDDPIVRSLHGAALGGATATSHNELAEASKLVAEAIKVLGISQWPHFVADAAERIRNPITVAALESRRQPSDPSRDAIRPVYPVETLLSLGAAGIVGGMAAAARAAGGAILKQMRPESKGAAGGGSPNVTQTEQAADTFSKPPKLPSPRWPTKLDDLVAQGWKEVSHPEAAKLGHRMFKNPKTGEVVRFDTGRPGQPGFEGQDHYHRLNPNSTSSRDAYLDVNGNPVARGSNPSHIIPRTP